MAKRHGFSNGSSKSREIILLTTIAAVLIFTGGCMAHSTYAGFGFLRPDDRDLADEFGTSWPVLEFGATLEEFSPLLVRAGIGHFWSFKSYSEYYADTELSFGAMTFRVSALYLFPETSETEGCGLYMGGGVSYYWWGDIEQISFDTPYTNCIVYEGTHYGFNFIAGYRHKIGPKLPEIFIETIFETVRAEDYFYSEKDIGGQQLIVGLNFRY